MENIDINLLPSLTKNDIMDVESVGRIYEDMLTKKQIQDIHTYAITPPNKTDGRWQTYIRKGGKRKKVVAPSEKGLYKILSDHYFIQGRTLETLFDEWLERRKSANVDCLTIGINKRHWLKHYANHGLVKKPLKDITVFDLEDFFHEQIKKHDLTVKELHNIKFVVKDMLHMCKRKGYIDANPYHDMELNKAACKPKSNANDSSRLFLPDECERFFQALHEEMQASPNNTSCHAIMLLFKFGLRIGELSALKWEDVDGAAGELRIRRMEKIDEVDGKNRHVVVPYTKKRSEYGFRELPLTAYEYDILEAVKSVNGSQGWQDGGYVFCNRLGRTKSYQIGDLIIKLCHKSGITPVKSSHDIRRTVATRLYRMGVPLGDIQKFLGHSDEKTTRGYIVDYEGKSKYHRLIAESLNCFSVLNCTQNEDSEKCYKACI